MIEANPTAFTRLRIHRPGVLAAQGAVCSTRGSVTFASRRSVGAAKRGIIRAAPDETGGVESMMSRTFERAGYIASSPTAWLGTESAYRLVVPCAPLRDYLSFAAVHRIDVFWLDVEGSELAVLESIEWSRLSVGILAVEMRFNDATRNEAIVALLNAQGFELVRALSVWSYKIFDCVFLRPEHFQIASEIPAAAISLLNAQRLNRPPGANVRYLPGRLGGAEYVVALPRSLRACTVWGTDVGTDGAKVVHFVALGKVVPPWGNGTARDEVARC